MPNEIESESENEIQIHDENETTDGSENQASEGEPSVALALPAPPAVGVEAGMQLTELAAKWRDTGSRYRTQCAREMLAVLGVELPELPPAEGEQIDSHVRIPVGGLIADLDDRLRRMREEITIQARRLGSHLLTLADAVESAPASHVAPMAVGEMGTRLDRACASYNATKELRVWLGRVAYQHRAAARQGR